MKIIIKTKNFSSSPAVEDYVYKKIETLKNFLKNFNEKSLMAEIELGRTTRHHQSGDIFRAEINLSVDGKLFRVESEQADIYTAIDEVRDDLEREIKAFKTKKETIFIRGARSLKKKLGISPLARFKQK